MDIHSTGKALSDLDRLHGFLALIDPAAAKSPLPVQAAMTAGMSKSTPTAKD